MRHAYFRAAHAPVPRIHPGPAQPRASVEALLTTAPSPGSLRFLEHDQPGAVDALLDAAPVLFFEQGPEPRRVRHEQPDLPANRANDAAWRVGPTDPRAGASPATAGSEQLTANLRRRRRAARRRRRTPCRRRTSCRRRSTASRRDCACAVSLLNQGRQSSASASGFRRPR